MSGKHNKYLYDVSKIVCKYIGYGLTLNLFLSLKI